MDTDDARERLRAAQVRVEELIGDLRGELGVAENEDISELSDYDQHPADTASETFEREKDLSILDRIDAQLADVARAEKRLAAGTYGTCEACGRPIDEDRLRARPAARFCLDDQHLAERAIA